MFLKGDKNNNKMYRRFTPVVNLPRATLSVSTFREKWLKNDLGSKVSHTCTFVSLSFIDGQAEGFLVMCYINIHKHP